MNGGRSKLSDGDQNSGIDKKKAKNLEVEFGLDSPFAAKIKNCIASFYVTLHFEM